MACLMASSGFVSQAATVYWDTDTDHSGNAIDGTNLGGAGIWDLSTPNWWDGANPLSTWPNSLFDTAIFNGTAGVVTLGADVNAGTLMFQSNGYQITGANTLTLGDVARLDVAAFTNARIDAVIAGSAGLLKTGNGTMVLGSSGGNTYTGDTVINAGALVITNQNQLGASSTAISINGIAQTGNPGFTGGQLVVNGVSSTGPVTMTREISISGRGPGAANGSGGLVSVGNNTFNGDISLGGPASEGRILATHGITTINGDMFLGTGAANLFFGNGNIIANGKISGVDTAGDRFVKTGNLIGTTLWLANAGNDFRQTVRVDSGTIRVSGPDALAKLGVSTSTQALDSNGGFFEIHTDVTDFSTKSFRKRGNGGGIFADHDFGSTLLNQNILLNDLLLDANASFQLNARNGYGLTISPVDGVITWTNGGTGALTNNGNGALIVNANINRNSETTGRTFTITGNGTTILNGNLLQAGTGAVSLTKGGTGVTRILGTASTATGATNIGSGTLEVAAMTSLPSGTINIGNATTTSGALTYIGAGETSSKTINLNTTTASAFINSSGTGALVLNGTINAVSGNKTLFLGGSNTDANEIASAIPAAGGTVNLNKHGAGTWVLSGANLYTGITTVAGGTLQVKDTFSGSSRNVIVDTSNVVFNQDARSWAAGGIFEYRGDDANASAETLGSLIATAGAGTVKATAGPGGSADLTFSSLGTVSAGTGVNFVTNAGGSITLNGATDTNGIVNAHLFFNGADFASSTAGLIGAATYSVVADGSLLVAGNTAPYHINTADIVDQTSATINGGIKFSDSRLFTLAAAQTLTLNNGAATVAGGLLVTGASTVTISGGTGITTGGAADLVFRTDGAAILNLNTPILNTSTGGWTKLGAGTLVLGAANAGTTGGQVHINEGTVQLATGGRLGADSMDVRIRQGATLDLNGVSLGSAGSGTASIDELFGAGILTNTGAAATIRVGNGNGSSTFTGEISGLISIAKNGSGTVRVQGPQTYTGVVQLNAGNFDVSHLANIGQASGLGTGDATDAATNAASLVFNGGVLRYIGQEANNFHLAEGTPSVSIDRLFTMAGNGTISSFGSAGQNANQTRARNDAALVFNNTAPIAFSGSGNRTLTIRGDSLGDNYMGLQLTDNPATGTLAISKFDSGLWILGNVANSYTGVTTIGGGALRAQDGTTLPTASNLLLNGGGGVLQTSGNFTRALGTGANQVRFNAADQRAGFAASEAPLTVNLGTSGLVWGSSNSPTPGTANFLATGTLYLSSSTSWADTTFANDFEVTAGINKNVTISTPSSGTLSTITLTSGNTSGMTVGQAISGTNIPAGAYIVSINSNTQISISANATAGGTGIAATVSGEGFRDIRVDDNGNTGLDFATASGVISGAGGLGKEGTGLLILGNNNTYSGKTVIRDGLLVVSSIGAAGDTSSSLGTNVGGGALEIGRPGSTSTAQLLYVGPGETTTRAINLVGTTGTRRIDSSGSGALILTNLANNTVNSVNTSGGAKTLELRGNNTDGNMITSVLANNGGALTITKADGGVWILNPTAANTFTGNINASGGMLGLTANGIGSAGLISISNGAIFGYGGDLTTSKTINWANNSTAVFAGSNNITLNGTFQVAAGNNDGTFSNNLENGAVLTINNNFTNLKTNNRTLFIRGYGSTVWNGSIQDAAANTTAWDIRIANSASFTTTGAANTYSGTKTLGQGTFILDKVNPLGPSGTLNWGGGVLTVGSSISDLAGANAISNPIAINGDPTTLSGSKSIEFSGTLTNSGGDRKLQNNLSGGATLGLSGTINLSEAGNRTLWLIGSGDTSVSGVIQNGGTATASALRMAGTGTLTLTNANTYDGATTIANGIVELSGNGSLDQNSVIVVEGNGKLRLDNSVTNLADRVNSASARDINLDGGTLEFIGNAAGSSETFGRLDINRNGMAKIIVSGGDSTLTFGGLNFANTGSSLNLVGIANLGTNNKVLFTTAPTGAAVSNGILSRVAIGSDFAEYDGTNGVQAFTAYNTTASLLTPANTDTVNLTASANIGNSRTLNALRLDDATGFTVGSTMNASILTLTSGALIATGGGTHTLSAPIINTGTNGAFFQVTSGTTLNIDSVLTGAAFTTLQAGTVNFNTKQFFTSTFNQHAGTVKLGGGLNTIMPLKQAYFLNSGATLDLNGNTQFIGNLNSSGDQPGVGGTVVNTAGTTATIVTDNGGTWMGDVSGDINFGRVGGSTLTVGSAQTYTGWTYLNGGTTTLRDDGALQGTSGIDINVATLILANNDNLQRLVTNRVNDSADINLRAATITFNGTVKSDATESLGAISALLGANTISANSGGTGTNGAFASARLTIDSLSRSAGSTINFTGSNLGSEGTNAKIIFTTPLTALGNGVLGAWAIANTSDYAAYNQSNGVGVVGNGGFVGYDADFASGSITNLGMSSAVALTTTLGAGTTTTGLLRFHGGFTNDLEFTSGTDVLHLELGGILRSNNNNAANIGTLATRGVITSGTGELVVYNNQNTLTIHSVIDGATSFVKSGAGTTTLTAPNTYSLGTVVNQGTLRLEGDVSTVVVPSGGLAITSGTVTMVTNAGQIDASNVVTLNGSSTLNLVGNNTLDSLVFNHVGGTGNPTVNTNGALTLTNATPISVTINTPIGIPTVAGSLNFGSGAKTINVGAIQMNGVVIDDSVNRSLNITAAISGTGPITKIGNGLLGMGGQGTFTGGLNIAEGRLVIAANSTSTVPNGLVSGPLGIGSVAMASGTKLSVDDNSRTVANAFTFASDPIFGNTGGSTDTMTLNGALTFSTLGSTGLVADVETPYLNVVLGGPITGIGSVTAVGSGSGANTINKTGPGNISGINLTGLSATATVDLTGLTNLNTFSLLHDGDGTSGFETINLGTITFDPKNGSNIGLTIGRAGTGVNYPTPAFKTIELASLNSASLPNGFTLTNNNGYGLVVPDDIALASGNSFSVSAANTSLQIAGLTLSGQLTGGNGISKAGNGTLRLADPTNSFTGTINITNGTIEAASDGAFGNGANIIQIGSDSLAEGLRISGDVTTSRIIHLNAASSGIDVTGSNTLQLDSAFTFATATNALRKNDLGTLVLTQAQTGWDGVLTIGQGVLRITDGAALGTTTGNLIINNVGASLELPGGVTVADAIRIASTNNSSSNGINSGGAIRSTGGTNTLTGAITIDTTTADSQSRSGTLTADLGSILNVEGGIVLGIGTAGSNRDNWVGFGGEGTINLTTTGITHTGNLIADGIATLSKFGSGTLNIQLANAYTGDRVVVKSGTLSLNGAGTLGVPGAGGGVGTVYLNPTGLLVLDSSGTAVNNRLSARDLNISGADLTIIGNAGAAISETVGAFTLREGTSYFTLNADSTAGVNFTTGTVTRSAQATLIVRGDNLGNAAGAGVATISGGNYVFIGQLGETGTTNKSILPWAYGDTSLTGEGTFFLTADSAAAAANTGTDILRPLSLSEQSTTLALNANVNLTSNETLSTLTTINSLRLDSGGGVSLNYVPLTLDSGGMIALAGNSGISGFSGVSYLTSSSNRELDIHTVGDLVMTIPIAGTTGVLTKSGPGTLTLAAGNTNHSTVMVNNGTLKLGGGDQTILPGRNMYVNEGGVLDLNGTVQQVNILESRQSAVLARNDAHFGGGTVINSSGTQATLAMAASSSIFAGSIQGNIAVVRSNAANTSNDWNLYIDQSYTGPTLLNGGRTIIQDTASLSGTTSIEISNATLLVTASNNATEASNLTNRINDAATISLRGGMLQLRNRAALLTTETFGAVTLGEGNSIIDFAEGGTGVNRVDATLTSFSQVPGSHGTVRFLNIDGAPSAAQRLFINTLNGAATTSIGDGLTNNIIGGWATFEREFASYIPGQGVGGLNTQGFAGYSPNLINNGTASDNIRIALPNAGSTTLLTSDVTINSLNMQAGGSTTDDSALDLGGNTLTLASGGIILSPVSTAALSLNMAVLNGNLTAGTTAAPADLYLHAQAWFNGQADNTGNADVRIGANIVDNGAGGAVTLVINGTTGRGAAFVGTNDVFLNGSNTYTGGTFVNAGQVRLNNASANGTSVFAIPGDLTITGGYGNNSGALFNDRTSTVLLNFDNQINQAATVTLMGGGILNLSNNNQTIANLVFNNHGGTVPQLTTGTGTLTLTGGSITASGQNVSSNATSTINGKIVLSVATTTVTVNPVEWNSTVLNPLLPNLIINASVEGTDVVKAGNGVLRLNGSNAWTGNFDLQAGGLLLGSNNALSSGALTIGNNTFLSSTADNRIIANAYAVSGHFALKDAFNLTLNGAGTLAAGTHDISIDLATKILTLGGAVTGAGSINKTGDGILVLGNNSNAYGGFTTVSDGVLRYGAVDAVPTGSALTVLEGALVDITLGGSAVTVGSIASDSATQGGVIVTTATSGTTVITSGGDNTSTDFGGILTNAVGSTLEFVKIGTGTLTLGGANQYNGSTTVADGRLVAKTVGGNSPLGTSQALIMGGTSTSGILQLGDSSALLNHTLTSLSSQGAGTLNQIVSGNASMATLTLDLASTSTFAGNIGGSGTNEGNLNLIKNGAGDLVISGTGTSTYSGTTAVNAGKLFFDTPGAFPTITTGLTVADGTEFSLRGTTLNTVLPFGFSGGAGSIVVGSSAGATLGFGLDGTGNTQLLLTTGQTMQLTGLLTTAIYVNSAPTSGHKYVLIDGADAGSLSAFGGTFGTSPVVFNGGSFTYALSFDTGVYGGGSEQWVLIPTAVPAAADTWWKGDLTGLGTGVWSATVATGTGAPSNWDTTVSGGIDAVVPPDGTSQVHFSATGAGNFATTLGADMTIGTLTFHTGNAATTIGSSNGINTLTLGAGTYTPFLTLETGAGDVGISAIVNLPLDQSWNIEDTARILTLSGGLTGTARTLTVNDTTTNSGTLLFSGSAATMTGTLNQNAGTLAFEDTGSLNSGLNVVLGTGTKASTLLLGNTTAATGAVIGGLSNGAFAGSKVVGGNATTSMLTIGATTGSHTFSGALGGGGANENNFNLVKAGAGTQILDGAATYSGTTLVTEGTLQLGAASTFAPTGALSVIANAGTTATMDFNGKSYTTVGDLTLGGGTSGIAQVLDTNVTKGTLTLGGNIVYDATNDPGGAIIDAKIATGGARTITVGSSTNATDDLTLNGTVAATGSMTIAGAGDGVINGAWTLAGTNLAITFNSTGTWDINATTNTTGSGDWNINTGTINANVSNALNAADDIVIDGTGVQGSAIINIGGTAGTSGIHQGDDIFIRNGGQINVSVNNGISTGTDQLLIGDTASASAAAAGLLNLSANINVGGGGILVGSGTNIGNVTGAGIITTTGNKDLRNGSIDAGITLAGSGQIFKQTNGTLTFAGTRDATVGNTNIREGTLVLDYTTNNNSKIGAVLNLGLSGVTSDAALILNGNASATTSQSVASTTVLPGNMTIGLNNGAGQTLDLNLLAITRNVEGGTVFFEYASADAKATSTSPAGTLGWATVKTGAGSERFAAIDGSGDIVQAAFTTQNTPSLWTAGQDIIIDGVTTGLAGDCTTISSLTFTSTVASTLNVASSSRLQIATGGIMVDSGLGAVDMRILGGELTGSSSGVLGEIIVHQNNLLGSFTIGSNIVNSGGITKTGVGTLILSGSNSFTFGSEVNINEGTVQISGGNAIGDTTNVRLHTGTTLNLANSNEVVGSILDESNGTIALGTGDLTVNQTVNADYRGVFTGGAGSVVTLNGVNGAGTTFNLNVTGATTTGFTGTVVVEAGLLQLSSGGRLANATAFTINKGGNLLLDNNSGTRSDVRILDTATITLNSADGGFNGTSQSLPRGLGLRTDQDSTNSETVGVITANSGASYVTMEATTANDDPDLRTVNLVRIGGATLNIRGTNLGTTGTQRTQFEISNGTNETAFIAAMVGGAGAAASKNISIVPWAIGQTFTGALAATHMGDSLVTYVAGAGIRPLNLTTEYSTFASKGGDTDNVRESLSADLTGLLSQTVNGLVIHKNSTGAGTISVTGAGAGATLTNTSGAFLFSQNTGAAVSTAHSVILGGFEDGVQVGGNEYVFHVVNPSSASNTATVTATVASPLNTVGASVTKSGRGTLEFTAVNTYGGGTTINEGSVLIHDNDNLGTGSVILAGGTLRIASDFTDDLGTLATPAVNILSGGGTIQVDAATVTATDLAITGAGALTKTGTGTLQLAGTVATAHTGLISVVNGALDLNKTGVNAIGTGGLLIATNGTAGTVRNLASNQIADTATVTLINSGTSGAATWNLNGFNETIGSLEMTAVSTTSTKVLTGAGVLTVNGNITLNNNRGATGNTGNILEISGTGSANTGTLDLGGATRTITVESTNTGVNLPGSDANIETVIQNGGIIKEGSRALILSGTNTYTGGTTVNNGEVNLQGSLAAGAVTVGKEFGSLTDAAILSGTGTIAGAVTIGDGNCAIGVLAPGTNAVAPLSNYGTGANGTMTITADGTALTVGSGSQIQLGITNETFNSSAFVAALGSGGAMDALNFLTGIGSAELGSWNALPGVSTDMDFLNLTGTDSNLSLGTRSGGAGTGIISVVDFGYITSAAQGDVFNLVDWTQAGVVGGTFSAGSGFSAGGALGDFDLPILGAGLAWDTSAFTTYGVIVVVPEPSRVLFLMLGLLGLMLRRRRKAL